MFYLILIILHLVVSLMLMLAILLQSSKGGGLAGSPFGGGTSMAFLGARGTANFLSRATTILAVIFMLNSLGLSLMGKGIGRPVSVTQQSMQTGASNLPRVPSAGGNFEGIPGQQAPATTPSGGQQQTGTQPVPTGTQPQK
jgi:preprotein translocase subunit SecG